MADVIIFARINGIRYTDTAAIVTASERRAGYKKQDGTIVNEELLTWRIVYKPYFKSYIAKHFSENMLVKITGTLLPYTRDRDGNITHGYTILGDTLNLAAHQTAYLREERKRIKESQSHSLGTPNLAEYNAPDF